MNNKLYKIIVIFLYLSIFRPGEAQQIAIKTNLLYWATTTPNLGVEVALRRKITLDLAANYNAWDCFPDNMSLRHYLIQPELRYWTCKRFEGHFFGLHAMGGEFNIGNIPFIPSLKEYMYRGHLIGGGLSYGFHWVTGKRWGIELEIGAGYLQMKYDKYICRECAEIVTSYKRNYFGPTRIAFNLVYFIH